MTADFEARCKAWWLKQAEAGVDVNGLMADCLLTRKLTSISYVVRDAEGNVTHVKFFPWNAGWAAWAE